MKKYSLTKLFEEKQASFFPIYIMDLAATLSVKKILGVACNVIVNFYKKTDIATYVDMDSWINLSDVAQSKLLKEKNFCLKIEEGIIRECKNLEKFCHKLLKTEPIKLSDENLIKLYRDFEIKTLSLRSYAWIPNLVDSGSESIFSIAEKEMIGQVDKKDFIKEYLAKLTTSTKLTQQRQNELNLYKIQDYIIKNKIKNFEKDEKVINLIDKHVKKFGWLAYYYIGPAWDRNDIFEIIESNIKTIKNPEEKIAEIYKYKKDIENEKKKLRKKLKLNTHILALLDKICSMIFLKAYRKEYLIYSNFCFEPILKEIGNRLGFSLPEVRFLMRQEIEKFLLNKKLLTSNKKKELQERYSKGCVSVAEKGKVNILSFAEGQKYCRHIISEKNEKNSQVKELLGSCAFPGVVTGRARIINSKKEVNNIKIGEILVSRSTNPDLITAMQKASAFITNEGGITCHAAIVAREMKKPCIVGTKIATEVIKDGDCLEIDAGKGIIKILK